MNIDRLAQFKLVADGGHLRDAAERLGITPGALSRSLKTLEAELGVRLFRAAGRRLVLSDGGRRAYAAIERLLDEYAVFRRALETEARPQSLVRFCSHSVFTTYFVGHALRERLPDEMVTVRNLSPGAIEASVASSESDFGMTYAPVPTEGVEIVPIARFGLGAFVRRGAFRGVAFERIPCSIPILHVSDASALAMTVDAWPAETPRESVRYRFDLLETALESARQGLSWGYFPKFVVWLHNQRVRPELALEPPRAPRAPRSHSRTAYLVKRVGADETRAMKLFTTALRQICKQAEAHFTDPSPKG